MNPTVAWVLDVFDAARRRGTALDLREQRLGDGDVRDLANALRSGGVAGPIEGLNLGRNFVGDGGAEALAGLLLAGPRQAAQTHVQGSRILQEILFLLSFQLSTCTGVSSGRVRRLGFLQTLSFCLQPQSSKRQSSKPFGNRR